MVTQISPSGDHVLIVGNRRDPHVLAVHGAVAKHGKKCAILDRYTPSDMLTMAPGSSEHLVELSCGEGVLRTMDVCSVWWRLKKARVWEPSVTQDLVAEEF